MVTEATLTHLPPIFFYLIGLESLPSSMIREKPQNRRVIQNPFLSPSPVALPDVEAQRLAGPLDDLHEGRAALGVAARCLGARAAQGSGVEHADHHLAALLDGLQMRGCGGVVLPLDGLDLPEDLARDAAHFAEVSLEDHLGCRSAWGQAGTRAAQAQAGTPSLAAAFDAHNQVALVVILHNNVHEKTVPTAVITCRVSTLLTCHKASQKRHRGVTTVIHKPNFIMVSCTGP